MKKIITILILIMMPAVFAADACQNTYATISQTYEEWTSLTYASGTDSSNNDVTITGITPSTTTLVNFASRTDNVCTDTDVYESITWTGTDQDTDSSIIAYTTDGYVAVIGTQPNYPEILNINFYTPTGTVVATLSATFDDPVDYDMKAADYSAGGIVVGVVSGYKAFSYHITTAGEQWGNAYVTVDNILQTPRVYSNNDEMEFAFDDGLGKIYDFNFDITDGSLDKSTDLTSFDGVYLNEVYLDASGNSYLLIYQPNGMIDGLLKFVKSTSAGAKSYERGLSANDYNKGQATTEIVECGTNLCFGALFYINENFNSIFVVLPSTGVVQKEIQFSSNMEIYALAAKGDNLYATGIESAEVKPFVTSMDLSTYTTNYNYLYSEPNIAYYSIAVGTSTLAIAGYTNNRIIVTLLDEATGSEHSTYSINVENNGNPPEAADVTLYNGNLYAFTGYVGAITSGYTGLYGITSDVDGPVPEFSLTTIVLAILLAGGLVLFVVRRRK